MSEVDEQRDPRTRAAVNQLLDRHLEVLGVEETTLDSYESFVRNHIRSLIGDIAVGRINGEILDSVRPGQTRASLGRGRRVGQGTSSHLAKEAGAPPG